MIRPQLDRRRFLVAALSLTGAALGLSPSILAGGKAWSASVPGERMHDALTRVARLLYPHNDYFSYRALRRRGELSLGGWLRSWIGSTQPVFRWNDPMPAVGGFWRFLVTRFRARQPYRGPERRRSPRPDPD